MTKIKQLIMHIETLSDCRILKATNLPVIDEMKHVLPKDLKEFYSLCGA